MNESLLVGVALLRSEFGLSSDPAAVIAWLFASSSPWAHFTVTADEVRPIPVIWLYESPLAALAEPGRLSAISPPNARMAASAPPRCTQDATRAAGRLIGDHPA